jgi:hypothetical protein
MKHFLQQCLSTFFSAQPSKGLFPALLFKKLVPPILKKLVKKGLF